MESIKFHDPLIVKEQDRFYCFSTDTNVRGVQIAVSDDLLHWQLQTPALPVSPVSVQAHVGETGYWAPEVVRVGNEWRLYCCASQFGKSQSVIGLAASGTIGGPYTYRGDVLRTYHTGRYDAPNAIDPNVVTDRDGTAYLVYGSFFGGIYIARLREDGQLAQSGYGTRIAGGEHRAVEGGYVLYDGRSDRFYLFVSYGSLRYDYNIRVGTSEKITGPYLDSEGKPMTDLDPVMSVGDKIAGGFNFDCPGHEGWMGPGHNSILSLADGLYVVHHVRREGEARHSFLQLRKVFFAKELPQIFISPVPYDGTEPRIPKPAELKGQVSLIRHDKYNNGVTYGRKLPMDAVLAGYDERDGEIAIAAYGKHYIGTAFVQSDALYFTAIDKDGECVWGLLMGQGRE